MSKCPRVDRRHGVNVRFELGHIVVAGSSESESEGWRVEARWRKDRGRGLSVDGCWMGGSDIRNMEWSMT